MCENLYITILCESANDKLHIAVQGYSITGNELKNTAFPCICFCRVFVFKLLNCIVYCFYYVIFRKQTTRYTLLLLAVIIGVITVWQLILPTAKHCCELYTRGLIGYCCTRDRVYSALQTVHISYNDIVFDYLSTLITN